MAKTMVYVARRKCNCVVAAVVDDTDDCLDADERRKAISDCLRIWVRSGWRVDSIAAEEVPAQWFSACPHVARQPRLHDDSTVTVTNTDTGERVTVSGEAFSRAAREERHA
jgi:hypothetical protein